MQNSTFIGLDVHKAAISVAIAQGERGGKFRHWGAVPHRSDHGRNRVEKLGAGGARLHFCYEVGPEVGRGQGLRRGQVRGRSQTRLRYAIQRLAAESVAQILAGRTSQTAPGKRVLNFEILCPENVWNTAYGRIA